MGNQLIDHVLGRYRILNEIGKGAMGKVYLAEHIYTGKKIALKTLLMGWLSDLTQVERLEVEERFRREAQAAAQIAHENIVQIYDFDVPRDNVPAYISMELLEGWPLDKLLTKSEKLPVDRAILLMSQICAGIGEAHKRGLIHRDLKPANIMVIPPDETRKIEKIKIIDFGIAKIFDSDLTKITRSGQLMGTPKYMSPEQCRGEGGVEIDARADVYSLGLIFYEMLTGKLPFSSGSVAGWITCHLSQAPEELPDYVPFEIRKLIMRSIEKDRDKRPSTATAFGDGLIEFGFNQSQQLIEKQKLEEQTRIERIIQREKDLLKTELTIQFETEREHFTTQIREVEQRWQYERRARLSELDTMSEFKAFYDKGFAEIEMLLRELKENPISRIEERIEFYRSNYRLVTTQGQNPAEETEQSEDNRSKAENLASAARPKSAVTTGKVIRVYELARELKQDTKRIMEDLRREGADVSVPSNRVSEELAKKVRNKYFPKVETAPKRAIKIIRAANTEELPLGEQPSIQIESEPTFKDIVREANKAAGPRILQSDRINITDLLLNSEDKQ